MKTECAGWSAIHDFQPPNNGRLTVTAECTFPTPGYVVTLRESETSATSSEILVLEKTTKSPTTPEPDVITKIAVEFTTLTKTEYKTVKIIPDQVTIPVTEAHATVKA